jgi:hypothetical protein
LFDGCGRFEGDSADKTSELFVCDVCCAVEVIDLQGHEQRISGSVAAGYLPVGTVVCGVASASVRAVDGIV